MTPRLLLHRGPHVFVEDLEALELAADDRHHLQKALRLRPGDDLSASDGRGRWRSCVFGAALEPTSEIHVEPKPTPTLTVGFALVKGSRPELVVQKLTELGIDRIQPFVAERSVVQWDQARIEKNLVRHRRIAREAAMQSHQAWLPTVEPLTTFDALANIAGTVRADFDGEEPIGIQHHCVLVGPEGGFTASERAAVPAAVGISGNVLRAETAAIAAAVLMAAARWS